MIQSDIYKNKYSGQDIKRDEATNSSYKEFPNSDPNVDVINETCCRCRCLADVAGHCSYPPLVGSGPTLHPLQQMNSSLTTQRFAGIGNLILLWRELQRGRLQQGCTFVRYITNHSREKIISRSTCLSMARNVSNAIIVQNVTVEERH